MKNEKKKLNEKKNKKYNDEDDDDDDDDDGEIANTQRNSRDLYHRRVDHRCLTIDRVYSL